MPANRLTEVQQPRCGAIVSTREHALQGNPLLILGSAGVVEQRVKRLAVHLAAHGMPISVYCRNHKGRVIEEEIWKGIHLIHVPVHRGDAWGDAIYFLKSTWDAARRPGSILTFGNYAALFSSVLRLQRRVQLVELDRLPSRRDVRGHFDWLAVYLSERVNRWTATRLIVRDAGDYRRLSHSDSAEKCCEIPLAVECTEGIGALQTTRSENRQQFHGASTWPSILSEYESLLLETIRDDGAGWSSKFYLVREVYRWLYTAFTAKAQ